MPMDSYACADDGFISAKDLEQSMGRGADVKQMIAAADKNGDGKVWSTFLAECSMRRVLFIASSTSSMAAWNKLAAAYP